MEKVRPDKKEVAKLEKGDSVLETKEELESQDKEFHKEEKQLKDMTEKESKGA